MEEKKYLWGLDLSWGCGVAIYDLDESKFVYVGSVNVDNVKLTAKEKKRFQLEHGKKLRIISDEFKKLISEYPPFFVSIERYFSRFNNATIALAKVHGVVNELMHDIPTAYLPPKTVKEAIISGNASKEDIQKIILEKYDYLKFKNDDESDAVAIALAQLIKAELIEWEKPIIKKKVKKITKKRGEKDDKKNNT